MFLTKHGVVLVKKSRSFFFEKSLLSDFPKLPRDAGEVGEFREPAPILEVAASIAEPLFSEALKAATLSAIFPGDPSFCRSESPSPGC